MSTLLMENATTFATEVDSHNGIYTFQAFVELFQHELIENGVKANIIADILNGPDDPSYWDSACCLLPQTFGGKTYFEWGDGDIFSLSNEEYEQINWEH